MQNMTCTKFIVMITLLILTRGIIPATSVILAQEKNISNNTHKTYLEDQRAYRIGVILVKMKPQVVSKYGEGLERLSGDSKNSLSVFMDRHKITSVEKVFPKSHAPLDPNKVDLSRLYKVYLPDNYDPALIAQKLARDKNVDYAEPIYHRELNFTPNDLKFSEQWHLKIISAEQAWEIEKGDSSVLIGIVDSGIDWQHPDMAHKIWRNADEIPDNGVDDDLNGYIDDIRGWDFGENDNNPANTSNQWRSAHGTHVAGIASAATNNGVGVAGIGFNCKIMAVKITRDYQNDPDQYVDAGFEGIKYAIDNGAEIINCSWSGEWSSEAELEIVKYAHERGVAIVAAAGNLGGDIKTYPGAYPYVLSVASSAANDQKSFQSNYNYSVDLIAPGDDIYSTWGYGFDYGELSGTSMSCPLVAGTIGLVKSYHPDWTAEQAAQQTRVSGKDVYFLNPGYKQKLGKGRLDALNALSKTSPAIRLESFSFTDSTAGDNNGVLEPGETFQIVTEMRNYLQGATNVKIEIRSDDFYMNILSGNTVFPEFPENSVLSNQNTPFVVQLNKDTPFNHEIEFLIEISDDNGYSDWEIISILAAPSFATHNAGNVSFTITNFGAFGYSDYAESEKSFGSGFQYPKQTGNALYHGSLLIGTSPDHVSDCAFGDAFKQNYDFRVSDDWILSLKPGLSDQDSYIQFDDSGAQNPLGVLITQRTFAWTKPPYNDFVVIEFSIQNTQSKSIDSLYAALYMDWDVDDFLINLVNYDSSANLGYQFVPGSKYYGISLIQPVAAASFRAIKNNSYVWISSYPDEVKWQFMTEGFQVVESDVPDDWSVMLSAGPFDLTSDAEQKVVFAVLGGEDEADLITNAKAANEIYQSISAIVNNQDGFQPPENFGLAQNFPNPFNQSTRIHYSLSKTEKLNLKIYNLQGQLIKVLLNSEINAGTYSLDWNGMDENFQPVASGIYLVKLTVADFTQTKKLVLIR